jgi:hypothetical protein
MPEVETDREIMDDTKSWIMSVASALNINIDFIGGRVDFQNKAVDPFNLLKALKAQYKVTPRGIVFSVSRTFNSDFGVYILSAGLIDTIDGLISIQFASFYRVGLNGKIYGKLEDLVTAQRDDQVGDMLASNVMN